MNERIRELEDQCWEDVPVDIDYDYLSRVRRVFNREKFAELIVRECANVAAFKDSGTISTAQVAGYIAAGRATAAQLIREHFSIDQNKLICPKCGMDRFKVDCPNPNRLECGIKVEAQ